MGVTDRVAIDREIKRFEPKMKVGEESHWAYRLLLTAPIVGPFHDPRDTEEKLEKFWRAKAGRFKTMTHRALRNGVWKFGPKNQKKFLDAEIYGDGIGFAIGSCVLCGLIKRAKL